jgi:dolichyl-phosphate-mannose-protein mannosyltransferase
MNGGRAAKVLPPLVLLAVVLAFYGRALGRPFTSEDFLLIRFLSENPPWRNLAAQLSAPWLGISVVKFYRPVSTLLYGLEIALFGGRPFGYNLAHVLVHALNAFLVWTMARKLGGTRMAWVAALLFALYPLHPNAVLFSASFATLFGATFLLASVLAYLRFCEGGSLGAWGAALVLFVLALGSYEETAVLPVLLAAYDHLAGQGRRHAALARGYLPFFGVLGLYLLFRRSLFGVVLGGYEEYSRQLLAPQLRRMAGDLATSIVQLHVPLYGQVPSLWAVALGCVLLIGGPLAFWLLRRRSLEDGNLRLWLFAWAWILVAQAPFAFRPCVPGNGRYWYLAAAGVALSVGVLTRGVAVRSVASAGLFGALWAVLLTGYVGDYLQAGRTARTIQGELLKAGRTPMFLTRYPYFLVNEAQTPIAQIFHYGLRDSVQPPFTRDRVPVYPLPPLAGAELLPVALGAPASRIYEWDGAARRIRPFVPQAGSGLAEFQVVQPQDGAVIDPVWDAAEVAVAPGAHARFRLIVVSRINGTVLDLDPAAVQGGVVRANFPVDFLTTADHLYGRGEHYWWIEARDAAGQVSGFSRMRSFRLKG